MEYLDMNDYKESLLAAEEVQPDPPTHELVPPPQQDGREWTTQQEMAWEREQEFQYELQARAYRLNRGLFPFAPDSSEYIY